MPLARPRGRLVGSGLTGIGGSDQAGFAVQDPHQLLEGSRIGAVAGQIEQFRVRADVAAQVAARLGQQGLEHRAGGSLVQAILRAGGPRTKRFLQERHAHAGRPAHLAQRRRCPRPALGHLGKQGQPHGDDAAFVGQGVDGPLEERFLDVVQLGRVPGQLPKRSAERRQHLLRVRGVEQVDQRRVLALDQIDLQLGQKPADRQPEIVADQQQGLQTLAVALPQCLDQRHAIRVGASVQPLFQLIEDQQHLAAFRQPASPPHFGQRLGQAGIGRQVRALAAQAVQEPRLGVVRRGFDVHRLDVRGQPGQQARSHQRRLAATRRPVQHADGERLGGIGLFDAVLPVADALRQPVAIAGAGHEIQKETGVVGVEGPQPLRHDPRRMPIRRGRAGERRHEAAEGRLRRRRRNQVSRLQVMPQIVRQRLCGGVPVGGSLGQGLQADPLQFLGDGRVPRAQRPGLGPHDLLQQLLVRLGRKRFVPRQQFVQHDSQAEDVGARVHAVCFAAGLFGTHVRGRPGKAATEAEILVGQRQAEIGDEGLALGVQQDVGGLDVAMHESLRVRVMQRLRHRDDEADRFPRRHPPRKHARRQVLAGNEFGNDVTAPVLRPSCVVDRNDAGVIQAGDQAGFGQVGLHVPRLAHAPRLGDLDRHVASQFVVPGQVHAAEAALGQHAQHAIAADLVRRCFGRQLGSCEPEARLFRKSRAALVTSRRRASRGDAAGRLIVGPVSLNSLPRLPAVLLVRVGQGTADLSQLAEFLGQFGMEFGMGGDHVFVGRGVAPGPLASEFVNDAADALAAVVRSWFAGKGARHRRLTT